MFSKIKNEFLNTIMNLHLYVMEDSMSLINSSHKLNNNYLSI